jgi:hypothetical protein
MAPKLKAGEPVSQSEPDSTRRLVPMLFIGGLQPIQPARRAVDERGLRLMMAEGGAHAPPRVVRDASSRTWGKDIRRGARRTAREARFLAFELKPKPALGA